MLKNKASLKKDSYERADIRKDDNLDAKRNNR